MRKISIRQVKSSIRYFYTVFLHLGIYYWQGKLQLPQRAMFILLLPFLFYIEPLWTVESCSQTSEGRRQVRRGAWLPPSYNFFHANNWANKWSSVQNVEIFIFISCREVAASSDWQWRTHCLRAREVWGGLGSPFWASLHSSDAGQKNHPDYCQAEAKLGSLFPNIRVWGECSAEPSCNQGVTFIIKIKVSPVKWFQLSAKASMLWSLWFDFEWREKARVKFLRKFILLLKLLTW